jgi:hypothetical protein
MSAASHRAARVVAVAAAAAAVLAAGVVFFAWAPEVTDRPSGAAAVDRPATPEEASAAFAAATAALQRGDLDAWRTALPVEGAAAREARRELYRRLSPLPWSGLSADVQPIPGAQGRFDVRFTGSLGATGPPDRIVADRVLELWRAGSRTVVVDDLTPPPVKDQYLMAFNRPVVVKGERCLVLAERSWRERARQVARASAAAHSRLDLLGLDPSRTTLVVVYASDRQLERARGAPFPDDRVRFFSVAAPRLSDDEWWPRDVGVLAPALADAGGWTSLVLAHELTHAYTMRWFDDTAHRPPLLLEGLAVAVEGGRSYEALRQELASGNETLPLRTALATGSLWMGSGIERVRLGYSMGGSLVLYVLDRWDLATLRDFVRAVADSDLSTEGVDAATRATLGVGWDEFVEGWTGFVWTLP